MEIDEKIVSVRVIAETNLGNKYYVSEDLGINTSVEIEEIKSAIEGYGLATDWLE